MKKHLTSLGLLLCSACCVGTNPLYAAQKELIPFDREADRPGNSNILALAKIQKYADFDEHQVELYNRGKYTDDEGTGWVGVQLSIGKAHVTLVKQEPQYDSAAIKAKKETIGKIDAAVGGSKKGKALGHYSEIVDERIHEEFTCDEIFRDVDAVYRQFQEGLLSFVNGETATKLITLAKAVKKLNLDHTPIGEVSKVLLKLIMKVKATGENLRASLPHDVNQILEVLNNIVLDCENYVKQRKGPKEGTRFEEFWLPKDTYKTGLSEYDVYKPSTKHVALEKIDITNIRDMFFEVEKTLKSLMEHNLKQRLSLMGKFLKAVDALKEDTEHAQNIKLLTKPFQKYEHVIGFIDRYWISPKNGHFTEFQEGVKHINMLIEDLSDYLVHAAEIVDGKYAQQFLPSSTGHTEATTALALPSSDDVGMVVPAHIQEQGQFAERAIGGDERRLENRLDLVYKYLGEERPATAKK
jgi:hypothetical protein